MRDKCALVTGANGFVGSHLCERLIKEGVRVKALVRQTSNLAFIKHLDLEYLYGDVRDPESLPAAVKDVDYVFHPAGLVQAKTRQAFFRVNQIGTRNLIEAVMQSGASLERFVHISSQAAAGPSPGTIPIRESDRPGPVSDYGESKLAAEIELSKYSQRVPVTIIRPPAVYGPRDSDILKIFRLVKRGFNLRVGSSPKYVSLVHVTDLVDCIVLSAANEKAIGQTFFAANSQYYLLDDLVRTMAKIMKVRLSDFTVPLWLARPLVTAIETIWQLLRYDPPVGRDKLKELSQDYWICSSEKAEKLLGWKANIEVESGLRQTYEWYRQQRWL